MLKWIVESLPSFFDAKQLEIHPGLTLVVGPNNSGKTSLLQQLDQFFASKPRGDTRFAGKLCFSPLGDTAAEFTNHMRATPPEYRITNQVIHLRSKGISERPFFNQENKVIRLTSGEVHSDTLHALYRKIQSANSKLIQIVLGQPYVSQVAPTGWLQLHSTGSNLASAIDDIQESKRDKYLEWQDRIRRCFPRVNRIYAASTEQQAGSKTLFVVFAGQDSPVPFSRCGTGLIQCAVSLYAVMFAPDYAVVLLDEAFQHLHPDATKALIASFVEIAGNKAILAATHDPTAVRSPFVSSILLLKSIKGKTAPISIVNSEGKLDVLRELGLDYSDLAFAEGVLIVEGDSEERMIRDAQLRGEFPNSIGVANLQGLRFLGAKQQVRRETLRMALAVLKAGGIAGDRIGLFLDSDGRNDVRNGQIREDFKAAGGRQVAISKRRTLESYFLNAELLLDFIRHLAIEFNFTLPEGKLNAGNIINELNDALSRPISYPNGVVPESVDDRISEANPIYVIDAIVRNISGITFDYAGRKPSFAQVLYSLGRQRGDVGVRTFLEEVVQAANALRLIAG